MSVMTKIVVTGSKIDMDYYQDIKPWTLGGGRVSVVTDNDHLGLLVSGVEEEQKNVDKNTVSAESLCLACLDQHCHSSANSPH